MHRGRRVRPMAWRLPGRTGFPGKALLAKRAFVCRGTCHWRLAGHRVVHAIFVRPAVSGPTEDRATDHADAAEDQYGIIEPSSRREHVKWRVPSSVGHHE